MANDEALTGNVDCPACIGKRVHTKEDWKEYHALKGHGYTKEQGWSFEYGPKTENQS
jgi:hypothetical protein